MWWVGGKTCTAHQLRILLPAQTRTCTRRGGKRVGVRRGNGVRAHGRGRHRRGRGAASCRGLSRSQLRPAPSRGTFPRRGRGPLAMGCLGIRSSTKSEVRQAKAAILFSKEPQKRQIISFHFDTGESFHFISFRHWQVCSFHFISTLASRFISTVVSQFISTTHQSFHFIGADLI